MLQKCGLGLSQMVLYGVWGVGHKAEIGAANAGAIEHKVQAVVAPNWAQDPMLDIVQGNRLIFDGELRLVPWAKGKQRAHRTYAFFLRMVQNYLNGLGVI